MKAQRSPQPHIYVVDDEMRLAEWACGILRRTFTVSMSVNAEQALEHLANAPGIDVIVADVTMWPMTGPQLHDRAVLAQPALAGRFVFTTGGMISQSTRLFLDALPRRRLLNKPFSAGELHAAVQHVLLTHGLRRGARATS
jgi:response regulator RpfG family c-di-GMP phosphodiesterase